MFERSLSDLIKGLRSHRGKDEPKYVAQVMDEIRHEVRSGDLEVKAEACSSSPTSRCSAIPSQAPTSTCSKPWLRPNTDHKHVGYLAAAHASPPTLSADSSDKYDQERSAIQSVSRRRDSAQTDFHISQTPDLARHLGPDVIKLLTHSRPMIRKKALLRPLCTHHQVARTSRGKLDRLREKHERSGPRRSIRCGQHHLRARPSRSKTLPPALAATLPSAHDLDQQLDAHQDHQALWLAHASRASARQEARAANNHHHLHDARHESAVRVHSHTINHRGMLTQPGGDDLAHICVEKLASFLTDNRSEPQVYRPACVGQDPPKPSTPVAQHQESFLSRSRIPTCRSGCAP